MVPWSKKRQKEFRFFRRSNYLCISMQYACVQALRKIFEKTLNINGKFNIKEIKAKSIK